MKLVYFVSKRKTLISKTKKKLIGKQTLQERYFYNRKLFSYLLNYNGLLYIAGDLLHVLNAYLLYTLFVFSFPITRRFVQIKNLIWFFVISLAIIIWYYFSMSLSINFGENYMYLNFDSVTRSTNLVDYSFSFALTPLSYAFSFLVLVIGCATNLYVLNYFRNEADEGGFIFWLNSFIISMLILVLSNNFFTLFIGWELIGLTSFFLINFWQGRRATLKSSLKAFSFNLLSDMFLLGALVIFYQTTHTTDIDTAINILISDGSISNEVLDKAVLMLIACASIKSVQIIGHLWLPDSMEAPVPASALIHSATLVSAGIYLLLRFNILLVYREWDLYIVGLGAITGSYGGIVAAAQTDMKKLLAYSTMSHCGFLMLLVGLGNFHILVVYLFLHGIFKAATFFCAGSFIRLYGSQDTRVMGGGQRFFAGDATLLLICASNLCGLPLTIGVLYKSFFMKIFLIGGLKAWNVGFAMIGMLAGIVYFYRLVSYCIFDIAKWTAKGPYLSTNNLWVKFQKTAFFISKNHMLACMILISFGFYVFVIFTWLVEFNIIELDQLFYTNFWFSYGANIITVSCSIYLILFYTIYLLISIVLVFIQWRYQNYYSVKFILISYLLLIIFLIIFFSI